MTPRRRARRFLIIATYTAIVVLATGALFRAVFDRFPQYRYIPAFPENGLTVWRGESPLPIPPLSSFTNGRGDSEAYAAIVTYYDSEHAALALIFNESDDQRLRGLLSMWLSHTAAPYGVLQAAAPTTLTEYVTSPTSHCGLFTRYAVNIGEALGLDARAVLIDGGNHALTEFNINGTWEIFDASFNLWIDASVEELFAGVDRRYRTFYSPMTDPALLANSPLYEPTWYKLRGDIPQWGLSIHHVAYDIGE